MTQVAHWKNKCEIKNKPLHTKMTLLWIISPMASPDSLTVKLQDHLQVCEITVTWPVIPVSIFSIVFFFHSWTYYKDKNVLHPILYYKIHKHDKYLKKT